MKNTIYILFFVLFVHLPSSAQWTEAGNINGSGARNFVCFSMHADNMGNVYVAGGFRIAQFVDTALNVMRWDGSVWQALPNPPNSDANEGFVTSITTYSNSHLYATGYFTNPSGIGYVAEWNGSNGWYELGGQNALAPSSIINSMCTDNTGNLYAAYGGTVAKWNGNQWTHLGTGLQGDIHSICSDGQNIYAGGTFTNTAGKAYIAVWDGSSWNELGGNNSLQSITNYPALYFDCMTADNHGNIYAVFSNYKKIVVKWNGTMWMELAGINDTNAYYGGNISISADKYGNLYVLSHAADFHGYYSKWNGNNWIAMSNNFFNDSGYPTRNDFICVDTVGHLYTNVGYAFGSIGGYVAKYANAYAVGVEELGNAKEGLGMFPNPARDWVNVEFSANKAIALKITDISGRELKTLSLNKSQQIDISDLSNGIYFFSVYQNNHHLRTEKIIKE